MPVLQDFLGLISTAPPVPQIGDMVMRSAAGGWTTFNPGVGGQALTIDPNTNAPTWGPSAVAALPAASATYRGQSLVLAGAAGVADGLYVCLKSSTNTYSWKLALSG